MSAAIRRELRRTARLAWPLVGGQIAGVGMNFVDTVMAGRIDAATLGAVAVGSSSWSSILLFTTGVLMVVQASIAHLEGAGKRDAMAHYVAQAMWVAGGLAAAAMAALYSIEPLLRWLGVQPELIPASVGYLRALAWGVPALVLYLVLRFFCEGMGETRPTLIFGAVGMLLNVPLNAVLMFGLLGLPAMGARGCGLATAVVWWAQLVGISFYVVRSSRFRELDVLRRWSRPHAAELRRMLAIGLPIGGAVFLEASMFSAAALLVGSLGTHAMAGHQVALNFAALTFMVPLGISMATTVRVGQADGRGDPAGVRRVAEAGALLTLGCQLVSAAAMLWLPRPIAAIYTADPEVAAIAVGLLRFAALFQLSDGLQVSAAGSLRGLRDTRIPMLFTLVAYWGVGIPLGYWLGIVRGVGAGGLWIGMIAGLTVAGLLLAARFLVVTGPRQTMG